MKNEDTVSFIGKRIKQAREEAGLSQKELAKALGFETATAISLIESGERKIAVNLLEKTASTLHKSIPFFLNQEQKDTPAVSIALRADKDLSTKDKDALLRFYEAVKNKKNG